MKLGTNSTLISAYTALATVAAGFLAYEALRPQAQTASEVVEALKIESVHQREGSSEGEMAKVSKETPRLASH